MDGPRKGKDGALSIDAIARSSRPPFAKAS